MSNDNYYDPDENIIRKNFEIRYQSHKYYDIENEPKFFQVATPTNTKTFKTLEEAELFIDNQVKLTIENMNEFNRVYKISKECWKKAEGKESEFRKLALDAGLDKDTIDRILCNCD